MKGETQQEGLSVSVLFAIGFILSFLISCDIKCSGSGRCCQTSSMNHLVVHHRLEERRREQISRPKLTDQPEQGTQPRLGGVAHACTADVRRTQWKTTLRWLRVFRQNLARKRVSCSGCGELKSSLLLMASWLRAWPQCVLLAKNAPLPSQFCDKVNCSGLPETTSGVTT